MMTTEKWTVEDAAAYETLISDPVMQKAFRIAKHRSTPTGRMETLPAGYDALVLSAANNWRMGGQANIIELLTVELLPKTERKQPPAAGTEFLPPKQKTQ